MYFYKFSRHNSYNTDRGTSQLDCYEGDFIDDTLSLSELRRKNRKIEFSDGITAKRRQVLVCVNVFITGYGSTLYNMVFVFSPYIKRL